MHKLLLSVIAVTLFMMSITAGCTYNNTNSTETPVTSADEATTPTLVTSTSSIKPTITPVTWSSMSIPTNEITEENSKDWSAGSSDQQTTTIQDDHINVKVGKASVELKTSSGSDVNLRYQLPYGNYWDFSDIQYIHFWLYTENTNDYGFQNNWIELQTTKGDYFQYQAKISVLNSSINNWQEYNIPINGDGTWTLYPVGAPQFTEITAIEIHADTWGNGFTMWVDGLSFEPFSPGAGTVSPMTTMSGGTAPSLITIGPKISSLIVSNTPVYAGKSVALICHVTDPNDSPQSLVYQWSATNGKIEGTGYQVSFVDSITGTANINVIVSNKYGVNDTASLSIPVINSTTTPNSVADSNLANNLTMPMVIPVLVVKYIPIYAGGLNRAVVGGDVDVNMTLDGERSHTEDLTNGIVNALEEGSRYHYYKDTSAQPSLQYQIVGTIEILESMPNWDQTGSNIPVIDYNQIMTRINALDWVMNKGVKEIWIWGYDNGKETLWESNLSSPYGDVSNSNRDPYDLPIFGKTYTVYTYNYGRGVSEAVEDHMHQNEAIFRSLNNDLFWNKFVGKVGEGRCGWAHYPPNGVHDYDWANTTYIWTDIEDWTPDDSGQKVYINCSTWNGDSLTWFIFLMRSYPGMNNSITDGNKKLSNWWIFLGDYDQCKANGISLEN